MNNIEHMASFGHLEHDCHFLKTSKHYKGSAHGARILLLHNLGDFAKKKSSERWYRVWRRDRIQGWIFEGMQLGNCKTSD